MNDTTVQRELPIEFTASGSEYFRIWIVNLLLIVVSLGFYMPFAKARRLRYFYANTLVDGDALAFHGDPWRMFRGYVLMLVLFGSYAASGHVSLWASLVIFLVLALLWPALWRSSLRFRLGNTSWRGLRFGFEGDVAGAYRAMLPWFVPGGVIVAVNAWFLDGVDQSDVEAVKLAMEAQFPWVAGSLLLLLAFFPFGLVLLKRYQQGGYRYAQQRSEATIGGGSVYWLALKTLGLFLLVLGLPILAAVLLRGSMGGLGLIAFVALLGLLYLFALVLCGAYFAAGLQNLVWGGTRSAALRFGSQLGALALTWLQLKNLVLTLITLGLYRPFAVVNTTALRLNAVRLTLEGDMLGWRGTGHDAERTASGEMSGDFFGFDIGL